MKNLFGEYEDKPLSTKKKIHASAKKAVVKEHVSTKGLNEIYKNFGDWIVNGRSNKTI